MLGLRLDEWLDVVQVSALVVGGLWGLHIYSTARRSQVKVGIEASPRLKRGFVSGKDLLLVGLKISNTSEVLWRHERAVATLFDARKLSLDGSIRLAPFAEADPFLPVYGIESADEAVIARDDTFRYFEGQEITLEPGEQVASELAFPLDHDKLGLMAIKVWVSGRQQGRPNRPYEWAAFLYIDPDDVGHERGGRSPTADGLRMGVP
jgi:hypothetical protein